MPTATTAYPIGAGATSWGVNGDRRGEALDALPKGARRLLDAATRHGWKWALGWNCDTGGSAFVTVVARPLSGSHAKVEATWHTRGTGTPRLTQCSTRNGAYARTRWGASLTQAVDVIEAWKPEHEERHP